MTVSWIFSVFLENIILKLESWLPNQILAYIMTRQKYIACQLDFLSLSLSDQSINNNAARRREKVDIHFDIIFILEIIQWNSLLSVRTHPKGNCSLPLFKTFLPSINIFYAILQETDTLRHLRLTFPADIKWKDYVESVVREDYSLCRAR